MAVIAGGTTGIGLSDRRVWFGAALLATEIYPAGAVILILRWGTARGFV